jgi:predicted XRE-type DNA-binding protein
MRNSKKRDKKSMQTKIINGVKVIEGSDNVFRDLGFPEAEAVNLMARSHLMMAIEDILKKKKYTQQQAAKVLGVAQPRVSDLYNGKIGRFTVDMLMKWLAKLGKEVTIKIDNEEVA